MCVVGYLFLQLLMILQLVSFLCFGTSQKHPLQNFRRFEETLTLAKTNFLKATPMQNKWDQNKWEKYNFRVLS